VTLRTKASSISASTRPWCLAEKLAITLPSLLFLVWNSGLMRGQVNVPKRSHRLLAVLALLSVYYFVAGWKLGAEHGGGGNMAGA
jgi:hypothetical protein